MSDPVLSRSGALSAAKRLLDAEGRVSIHSYKDTIDLAHFVLWVLPRMEMLEYENATCAASNMVLQDKLRIERERADGLKAELAALRAELEGRK